MKSKKLITGLVVVVLAVGAISATAFAASAYSSPAQAVAGLTGRTEESVIAQRTETGDTYGTIANEAGVLDQFKDEMLSIREDTLAERVAAGTMTQERADEILAAMKIRQETCDGTGLGQNGTGACGANGQGSANAQGAGNGQKQNGSGQCGGNGTCTVG
jgi:hypothetical protein